MLVSRIIRVCASLLLIVALSGCQMLSKPQAPPSTWVPLPTLAPAQTPTVPPITSVPGASASPTAAELTPTIVSEPTRANPVNDPALGASWSRDQAWAYLLEHYPDPRLPESPAWEGPVTQGMIGATKYSYNAGLWTAVSAVPLVAPEKIVYDISLTGPGGYRWQAQVYPDGTLVAKAPETGTTPELIDGIQGTLHVLPDTSGFDDYFRQLGDDGAQYGVEGADEAVRTQLATLGGTGKVVQLWGSLQQGVPDYGDAQLLVTRLEVLEDQPTRIPSAQPTLTPAAPQSATAVPTRAPAAPSTEMVEGWIGVVRILPEGSAYNDFFRRPAACAPGWPGRRSGAY